MSAQHATKEVPVNEVIEMADAPKQAVVLKAATPADLLQMAVSQGADLDRLERLMALQERWEAGEARKAFVAAMTDFKSEPLEIFKRKQVGYSDKQGNFVGYKHAELSDITDVVVPAMARHGLSHRWDVKKEAQRVVVSCIITHKLGHSEAVTMDAAPDDSGKKNKLQQVASAVTYLERYTLLAATGMSTKEQVDDDGAGFEDKQSNADVWSTKAAEAVSLEALQTVSREGAKAFKDTRDVEGYKTFAAAVQARGAALRAAAPATTGDQQ